jgi:hypothetical protein
VNCYRQNALKKVTSLFPEQRLGVWAEQDRDKVKAPEKKQMKTCNSNQHLLSVYCVPGSSASNLNELFFHLSEESISMKIYININKIRNWD